MPTKTYELVTVTMQNGKLKCAPDWVHLYWKDGPGDIRWAFNGMPKNAAGAVVEFVTAVPTKYEAPLKSPGGFRPRGVHRGLGYNRPSAGSHLPDVVTAGNTQESGYFYYDVKLLDHEGEVIAQADPGGDNDPDPGPH
ncbi:MAG: hypothetical protein A2Y78_03335 [Acidobacteria bacterium RBG_13_68_16]|nr:MAG: hypothetical protein A2Y78_03335 [Acidobacteria bacterium RBG_13_68_16]